MIESCRARHINNFQNRIERMSVWLIRTPGRRIHENSAITWVHYFWAQGPGMAARAVQPQHRCDAGHVGVLPETSAEEIGSDLSGESATSLMKGATTTAPGTAEPPRYFQSLSQRMFSQVMLPCTPLTPCGTVAGMNSTSPALIVCDCPPTIFPF